MRKVILEKLMNQWGASKLIKVTALAIFGASAGAIIGANFVEDNSEKEIN